MTKKYKMTISRLTVDKLGVKLYDRVSAVIAELVANCYDADATLVEICAPMGELLSTKQKGQVVDKGFVLEVRDNGTGMTPTEVNGFYLIVGAERRSDPNRGDVSRVYKRKVMGRKGVGKLAPFGVCQEVEIITSGGKKIKGEDINGKTIQGYLTAHLILKRGEILNKTDKPYHPVVGKLDETVSLNCGTIIKLKNFDHRWVPQFDDFERQLAQRFGLPSSNWKIELFDSTKTPTDSSYSRTVGNFTVDKMEDTEVKFESVPSKKDKGLIYQTVDSYGRVLTDPSAGLNHEGVFYPITGWVGYSKHPYKDDLMAGVRIYCRGKIAAQTHIFNMKAGFTGEYDIRSYLVGELHADWLDENEDLIRTDRQDILWSHELGRAFEAWGQNLVKKIGSMAREPRKKKAWELFREKSRIEERIASAFPSDEQKAIRDNTLDIARSISKTTREDELQDPEHVESVVQLSLLLGPHITLDQKLREAADSHDSPISAITGILRTARIAELSSFGKIADNRVNVIKKIQELKDDPSTLEAAFQKLITEAPWLINPQWSPLTSNQSFTTLKIEFERYYKEKTGQEIVLNDFSNPSKRCDFVLSSMDKELQIIEIKQPGHALQNDEMKRINTYIQTMEEFLNEPGNNEIKKLFSEFKVTLVCDKLKLTDVYKSAFDNYHDKGVIDHIKWGVFLLRTRKMHEDFLNEAERQKKDAIK